ncbi:unnamed protein product [Rotaria sordida]|uniref:Uncharacterized protein n=1 Tax=Rotaria sordida TaxID=392033 RepID=A0A820AQ99_9BILA|nr:unnamed protein product [Rotaria sordida]CAF1540038.1 unnamed protein product [Rotaria sordida]CAF4141875.1 unnamed protein product [Rotaria sordida]CAF4193144.1 unnamed protein product [Rotaria sordida]
MRLLLHNIYNTIQDQLIGVLTQKCTRYQVHYERLSFNEYPQIVKLIENLILNIKSSNKKIYNYRALKTLLQSQTDKFSLIFMMKKNDV